jgi:hypothetical protein
MLYYRIICYGALRMETIGVLITRTHCHNQNLTLCKSEPVQYEIKQTNKTKWSHLIESETQ